jgi:hypothetical protein
MALTQLARDQLLQYGFTTASLTRPTAWFGALHSGFPGDLGSTINNELSGNNYARQALVSGNALTLSSHQITNAGSVTWNNSSSVAWSAATWWSITDAVSAGNAWAVGELSQGGQAYFLVAARMANPGRGYAVSDTVTITSGGGAVLTVDEVQTVNGVAGVITKHHVSNHGSISTPPANPAATTTSGSGTGCTVFGDWLLEPTAFTLNAGDTVSIATSALLIALA